MNLSTLLARHARYRPDRLAVIYDDQRLTYRAFNQRVNRIANALLELGLKKGDKVATILGNSLELLELYWAVAKTGMVIVPLSPLLQGQGLTTLLNDSDAAAVVTHSSFMPTLEPEREHLPAIQHIILIDVRQPGCIYYHDLNSTASPNEPPTADISDDDAYNIIYSSGTTGLPKGIVLTHGIRANYCTLFAAAYRMKPESVVLHVGSLIFNGAFLTLMPAFFLGATYIFHRQFDPVAAIGTIAREKVTHLKMVPSQIVSLLNAPNFSNSALQSLEMIGSVGAPLLRQHKELLHKHLPGRFYELYGITEGFMTILDKSDFPRKMDSVGTPPPFMEIRVVDEHGQDVPTGTVGEIIGRGPLMMTGYYKRPDLTANAIRDGWLYSGDLGFLDDDGFLYLVDRKKDMIISGGVNVYPKDIEEVIVQHPQVKEAAVFGIPSQKWGETPVAAVILKEEATITAEELKTWVNQRVSARFQRLHDIILTPDFPRSAAGKTLKRIMRESFWKDQATKI